MTDIDRLVWSLYNTHEFLDNSGPVGKYLLGLGKAGENAANGTWWTSNNVATVLYGSLHAIAHPEQTIPAIPEQLGSIWNNIVDKFRSAEGLGELTGGGFLAWTSWYAAKTRHGGNAQEVAPAPNTNLAQHTSSNEFRKILDNPNCDCNDIAENLLRANSNRGEVVEFTGVGGKDINVPQASGAEAFKYHQALVDDGMVYDPRLSPSPIPFNKYVSALDALNPGGVVVTGFIP